VFLQPERSEGLEGWDGVNLRSLTSLAVQPLLSMALQNIILAGKAVSEVKIM
jgi:hypothetical protein